ncbi:uncharacterized protein G2W53_026923 [Senna tora]|uniref:Uncharacterized protein n=1 Tax=Senna tora TaxID=362788 RepID=A0A834TG51_9FABA|nr:uncharacterized protein G2W53_026923 [Senna tora]
MDDNVDRRRSATFKYKSPMDKMILMTHGSLPRSFKAIRVGRPAVDRVDRCPSKINDSWVNFFSMQNLRCICKVKMKPWTKGNFSRSFKAIRLARGQIFDGRRRGSPSVHMHGQNEAYDKSKPLKKFQGNPTCARPNLRWTTTWIAVDFDVQKSITNWSTFFLWKISRAYAGSK